MTVNIDVAAEAGRDWTRELMLSMPGFELRAQGRRPVGGSIRLAGVAEMQVADICSEPVHVQWRQTRRADAAPHIKVILQVRGVGMAAQDGREVVSAPGDFLLLDDSRPYALQFDGPFQQYSIEVPRLRLGECLGILPRLTALRIDGQHGPSRFLRSFVSSIVEDDDPGDRRAASRLCNHAVELLRTAIYDQHEVLGLGSFDREALLLRAKAFVLANLHDPDLDVSTIANQMGMSVRSLYVLFESEELRIAQWIREQRLVRARVVLEDPAQRFLSICDIAMRFGFMDSAHFSSSFRATYGMTPSECRRSGP